MKKLTTFKAGREIQIPIYVKLKSLRPRNNTWVGRKRLEGRDAWITALPEHSKQEAWEFINREIHERMNNTGTKVLSQRSAWPLLIDLAEMYLTAPQAQTGGATKATRKLNIHALKKITGLLGDFTGLRADRFEKQAIWDYQEQCVGELKAGGIRNRKAGGCNATVKAARAIFGKRVRCDFWDEKGVKLPPCIYKLNEVKLLDAGSTKYVPPTADEEAKWFKDVADLKNTMPDSYAAFIMAYGAGFRVNECKHATWQWLKQIGNTWVLHIQIADEYAPKFNKERTVPITEQVAQELMDTRYQKRSNHEQHAWRMDPKYILQRGRKFMAFKHVSIWFKERGWTDNRVMHIFRKHFGSQIVTQTGNLYDAQHLLGHASYQTTERYYTAPLETPNFNVNLPKGIIA